MMMMLCLINCFSILKSFEYLAHLESLDPALNWMLKLESKDPLLVAFLQNKPLSQKSCILGVG
uniref:CTLH domain-containing protein n=1 Tax=Setaria viridis TaxID=4556 RepID=A0A4U6TYM8_SETVI|nr:hypothetical protein SEVIR_7G030474v2 [Setaria viridis]